MQLLRNDYKFSTSYYCIVFFGYLLTLLPWFRSGLFAAAVMSVVAIEIAVSAMKSDKKSDFISLLNVCVFAYLLYNLFSFIWITLNGFPISIYVEEFSNSILPVVFYFVSVIIFASKKEEKDNCINNVYKAFLFAFIVFSLVCILMYLWAPQFYCDYLFRMSFISKADAPTCRVRMEGFTGSTSMSYLAVAAMLVAARFMYKYASTIKIVKEKNKEADSTHKAQVRNLIIYSIAFIFSLIVVFLANGRAGMVAALLVIVYINFLVFLCFNFADKKYFYFEIALVIVAVLIMCIITPSIIAKIWARLVSLPGAIGQRSEQWISAINNMPAAWYGQWFGNGLGANGHKAIGIEGAHIVADGGLVKLYCEEGALGFSLFVFILLVVFRHGIKDLRKYFAELGIIGTALLMSIGSNIIAFQLCMPIFWFAAGVVGMDVIGNATETTNKKKEEGICE